MKNLATTNQRQVGSKIPRVEITDLVALGHRTVAFTGLDFAVGTVGYVAEDALVDWKFRLRDRHKSRDCYTFHRYN